jgi:hypothetical protein
MHLSPGGSPLHHEGLHEETGFCFIFAKTNRPGSRCDETEMAWQKAGFPWRALPRRDNKLFGLFALAISQRLRFNVALLADWKAIDRAFHTLTDATAADKSWRFAPARFG